MMMTRPVTVTSFNPEIKFLISSLGWSSFAEISTSRSEATMRAADSSVKKPSADDFFSSIIFKTLSRVSPLLDVRIRSMISSRVIVIYRNRCNGTSVYRYENLFESNSSMGTREGRFAYARTARPY